MIGVYYMLFRVMDGCSMSMICFPARGSELSPMAHIPTDHRIISHKLFFPFPAQKIHLMPQPISLQLLLENKQKGKFLVIRSKKYPAIMLPTLVGRLKDCFGDLLNIRSVDLKLTRGKKDATRLRWHQINQVSNGYQVTKNSIPT